MNERIARIKVQASDIFLTNEGKESKVEGWDTIAKEFLILNDEGCVGKEDLWATFIEWEGAGG